MFFAISVDHRIELKESKKKYNFLELAREVKNSGT